GIEILEKSCITDQGIPQSGGDKAHDGCPVVCLHETVGDPQLNTGIPAADRLRTSYDAEIALLGVAEVDPDEGCDLVLEDGVVRTRVQQPVAQPGATRAGDPDHHDGAGPNHASRKRGERGTCPGGEIGDPHPSLSAMETAPPPRTTSSGKGTELR